MNPDKPAPIDARGEEPRTANRNDVIWVPVQMKGGTKVAPIPIWVAEHVLIEVVAARRHRNRQVRLWVQGVLARVGWTK